MSEWLGRQLPERVSSGWRRLRQYSRANLLTALTSLSSARKGARLASPRALAGSGRAPTVEADRCYAFFLRDAPQQKAPVVEGRVTRVSGAPGDQRWYVEDVRGLQCKIYEACGYRIESRPDDCVPRRSGPVAVTVPGTVELLEARAREAEAQAAIRPDSSPLSPAQASLLESLWQSVADDRITPSSGTTATRREQSYSFALDRKEAEALGLGGRISIDRIQVAGKAARYEAHFLTLDGDFVSRDIPGLNARALFVQMQQRLDPTHFERSVGRFLERMQTYRWTRDSTRARVRFLLEPRPGELAHPTDRDYLGSIVLTRTRPAKGSVVVRLSVELEGASVTVPYSGTRALFDRLERRHQPKR